MYYINHINATYAQQKLCTLSYCVLHKLNKLQNYVLQKLNKLQNCVLQKIKRVKIVYYRCRYLRVLCITKQTLEEQPVPAWGSYHSLTQVCSCPMQTPNAQGMASSRANEAQHCLSSTADCREPKRTSKRPIGDLRAPSKLLPQQSSWSRRASSTP